MTSTSVRICAGLMMLLVASVASPESLLDKLKNEVEELADQVDTTTQTSTPQSASDEKPQHQPITEGLPEANQPIVLTLDGIKFTSDLSGGMVNDWQRVDSYLTPAVQHWGIASHVEHVMWNGDSDSTKEYIEGVKKHIEVLSRRAKREGREFIIVGHSWGSVLATRAIAELGNERSSGGYSGNTEPLVVDQFVTMGSPLSAQGSYFRDKARKKTKGTGPKAASPYIKSWKNYWLESDNISGSITAASSNTRMTEVDWLGKAPFVSHDAYFENVDLWNYIGSDVTVDIIKNARVSNSQPITPATVEDESSSTIVAQTSSPTTSSQNSQSKPPSTSDPDVMGLRLGMTYEQAVKALTEKIPGLFENTQGGNALQKTAKQQRTGIYRAGRGECVDPALGQRGCVNSVGLEYYKGGSSGELQSLSLFFIEDFANRKGTSLLVRVSLTHDWRRDIVSFDPKEVSTRKYGEPAQKHERKVSCKRFAGTPGLEKRGNQCFEVVGLQWNAASQIGPGQLNLGINGPQKFELTLSLTSRQEKKQEWEAAYLEQRKTDADPF